MTETDAEAWEAALLADMRAHDGAVTQGPLAGHPLLVMTSIGAKSGAARRAILTFSRDGRDYVVAGTAGGAPTDPGWIHNVTANPEVTLERGGEPFPATAGLIRGDERDRLWEAHVRALPWFAEYPAQTGRTIPMVRLTPRDG
jgi:deazaflavin-dependent oxidoreductase (nitroreductase family)